MNTDPFVRKALKLFDPFIYEECKGYTKQVDIVIGLQNLLKFEPHNHTKSIDPQFQKSF